ncbi:conserved Plasmodium protein, unknown function [Plasmodium sp. gorilla clade G1]|nr:conserved Plasmodium protein, unknown function [Plasmodium sp. gorilla clade G1]
MNTKNDVNGNIILNCKNLKRNIKRKIENFYDENYVDTLNYLNKRKNYGIGLKKDIFEKSKNESIKIDTPPLYNNNKRKLQLDYSDVKKQKINNNITSNVYQNHNVIINNLSNENLNNISNHSEVKDSNQLLNPLSSEIIKIEGNNNIIYNHNERENIKQFSIIPFEEQKNTNTILVNCDENNNENYNIKKNVLNILYQKDIFYNKLKNQIQKYKPLEIKCMDISLLLNKYKHESNNNSFNYNTQDDIINTEDDIINTQGDIINTQDNIINTQDNIINTQNHSDINNVNSNENIISSLHSIQQEPIYLYNKNEINMDSSNVNNSTSYNNNSNTTNYGKKFINDYQINNYDNNIFLNKDNNYMNKCCQNIKHYNNTIDNTNINHYKYFPSTKNINYLNDNMDHYIYENIININNFNNKNQIHNNVYISNFNINNNNDNITYTNNIP